MTTDLGSAVVVVTGASAGVGRATAVAFGALGARVALLARGKDGLNAAAREIAAAGGEGLPLPVDLADHAALDSVVDRIVAEWGGIDIWVNAAMVTVFSPVERMTQEEIRRVTEVTYLGSVYGTMAALKPMKKAGRGTIVQVGSALAYRGIPLQSAYCGAKFALRGFLESLRCELLYEKSPVHITEVHLAAFNTPQFDWARSHIDRRPQPLPPIFQPELAARAVLWAATHRRRELWIGFPAAKAILGARFAPAAFMDWMTTRQAYTGQLTQERDDPTRPNNLFSPLSGDFGAHGRFDHRARPASAQVFLTLHRGWTAGLIGLGILIAVLIVLVV